MKKLLILPLLLVLLCVALSSCHKKENVTTPKLTKEQKVKIKEVNVVLHRYENDLFNLDLNNLAKGIEGLYGKYPENLVAKDSWKNKELVSNLKSYLSDPTIKNLYKEVAKQYNSTEDVQKELNGAFKIYLSHFPNDTIPQLYTLISGMDFNIPSVFGYGNNLFICIDMYLGKDCKYYSLAGMPKYIAENCDRSFIALDCFSKGMVYKHLPDKTPVSALDYMIEEGKKLFFTQLMFPNRKPQDIIGYTDEKYEWATQYEKQVWQYFIEKNMIYSKDEEVIRRLTGVGPFTRDFGDKSAARLGAFIGWHIVDSYMKEHPETSLDELFKMTNSQKLLTESLYKP